MFVIALIAILGFGYWWWVNRDMNTGTDDGAYTEVEEEAAPAAEVVAKPSVDDSNEGGGGANLPNDCGNDLACGNKDLATCDPVMFTAQGGALTIKTTVQGSGDGSRCQISSSVALSQLAGIADASLDKNGDGELSMQCTVQMGLDFNGLTAYLKGPGLQSCSGELKAFYDSLGG